METAGVLVLSCGVWVLYCGINGIPVWGTVAAVAADPSKAADTLAAAKTASKAENGAMAVALTQQQAQTSGHGASAGSSTGGATGVYNPFANLPVSDGFGARGGEHKGIDYMTKVGTVLPAAIPGTLHFNPNGGSGGYIATITGDNGYTVNYMHLSAFNTALNGQHVNVGDIVGYSGGQAGATGAGDSTGPHIHFQVNTPAGVPINPNDYFK